MRPVTLCVLSCLGTFGAAVFGQSEAKDFRDQWISVADRLIQSPPEAFPFNWGEGVQWIGLMKTYERTRDARYLAYMEKWTSLYIGKDVGELLNLPGRRQGKEQAAYCGHWSPATAILLMNRAKPKAEYGRLAREVAAFIHKEAERSGKGALGHWQGSHQLWVDTLYMACPLLAGVGKDDSKPEYVADAARQIVAFAEPLQDAKTGLFYHMWDWETKERTTALWGRGNGWVLMSIADTVEVMKGDDPLRERLLGIARRMLEGLARTRDAAGLWHTVLDDATSYEETSASAMVVYGVKKLIRLGAIDGRFQGMADKAWAEINRRYVKDGLVTGVSAGTRPKDGAYYRSLPAGTETWGTGAYLMAGSEAGWEDTQRMPLARRR